MLRKNLLLCGILAVLLYVATDIIAAMQWEGYSYTAQTVSELWAIDAPTRPFVLVSLGIYTLLLIAFGFGMRQAAGLRRSLRISGWMMVGIGVVGLLAPLAPMHQRTVLAAGGATVTDTMHLVVGGLDVLFTLLIIGFGGNAFGKSFRFYSIATIALLVLFGALTGMEAPRLQANLPTPYAGLWERINIFGFLAWTMTLAVGLLRETRSDSRSGIDRVVGRHERAATSV